MQILRLAVLLTIVLTALPLTVSLATEQRGSPGEVVLFEGWNRVESWEGPDLDGVAEIIGYLDERVEPPSWDAIAHFDGEWTQSFRQAPLPSFNTLREVEAGEEYWLFVTQEAVLNFVTPACELATGDIAFLDKQFDVVLIHGLGDYTGWYLISENGGERYDFPDGFVNKGAVEVHSDTAQFPNQGSDLWWTSEDIWPEDEDDDAYLYNCAGELMDVYEDGD